MTTTRPIDASRLSVELGYAPIRVTGPDADGVWEVEAEGVDLATLTAAVNAHVVPAADSPPVRVCIEDRIGALENRVATLEGR